MKKGVDNADLALARMRVVRHQILFTRDMSGLRDWISDDCNRIS